MTDQDNKAIGDRLQIARRAAGYDSATEAAAALGISYPTYAGHENGTRGIGRAAAKYTRRYKVSLDWLMHGKGPGPALMENADPKPRDELDELLVRAGKATGDTRKQIIKLIRIGLGDD